MLTMRQDGHVSVTWFHLDSGYRCVYFVSLLLPLSQPLLFMHNLDCIYIWRPLLGQTLYKGFDCTVFKMNAAMRFCP